MPPTNFILFQLNFDVKLPLLCLLLFLIDLKSTILSHLSIEEDIRKEIIG